MMVHVLSPLLIVGLSAGCAFGQKQPPAWTELSLSTCRVDEFRAQHPESDGRGVVIAVLDTGVDPSIPGLTRTPDGQVKVIDVQDFTGEGDIELHRVRLDPEAGDLIECDEEGVPVHYKLPADLPPGDEEERRYWFGTFDEKKFVNADVSDLNDNGSTEDQFPILVTALEGDGDDQALCYVDTNVDRSFADEKPLQNYKINYDTFTFFRSAPEKQIVPAAFAVNVFLRQAKIVLHWDDGAHGTHVAGIAAGYRINDQEGFDGVAPGAKVISLKIGQNAIGGVSTTESMKKAFQYAARFAQEHGVPVVCNMSYGVESVTEGESAIDRFVDKLLQENPCLVFCTSAGNEGPGLSSIGTPSAAARCICVGALLAADSARDVRGYEMKSPVVTLFSSRGGELDKPDIVTPGWSTSTVPRWVERGDFWSGTSMASPYAAGLCAVLISDVRSREPQTQVRAWDVKRALWLSGRPLEGFTALDTGFGIPDLPKAAEALATLHGRAKDDPVIGYKISTFSPNAYDGKARAAYWRAAYLPDEPQQTFTIEPVFGPTTDASARTSFTRRFVLRSQTPWCRVNQEQIYLRGAQSATVQVDYDVAQLTEPGIYVGVVDALCDERVEFRLLNTVVVPQRFTAEENFTRKWSGVNATGWLPQRYFLEVPPGASALKLKLEAPEEERSKARMYYLFDPTGHGYRKGNVIDTDNDTREATWTIARDLTPGVWELVVSADRPDREWPYDLSAQFFGLHAGPAEIAEWSDGSGDLVVTNLFERPLSTNAEGRVEGFRKSDDAKFKGLKDTLKYDVELAEGFNRIRLELEMSPEAYAETTDIGVLVKDSSGEALLADGFSNRIYRAVVNAKPGTYTVEIVGGFALADDQRKTPITVKIDHLLSKPVSLNVEGLGTSAIRFIPGVPVKVEFKLNGELPDAPDETNPVGYLQLNEKSSGETALYVPIEIAG